MPLGPIQYLPQPADPFQTAQRGLQLGETIRGIREKRASAQQASELKVQYSADLQSTFNDPTPSNIAMLTAKYPGQREAFKQSFGVLSEEQKKNEILKTGQVYNALASGNTEAAMSLVDEQIEASKNSGKDTTKLESIRNYITKDPKGAAGYTGLVLSSVMGEDDFAKTFETISSVRRAEQEQPGVLEKQGADLGLTKAQTNKVLVEANKLGTEAKRAVMELEADKQKGFKDDAKTFDQEEKLRKEYTNRTKGFTASEDAFAKISVSASDESGAGDIALITSFMKMLDPGSVVRETEFATAQDTAGLLAQLQNAAEKVQTGKFLTAKQRTDFSRLAGKYMEAARKQERGVRDGLNTVVKNYDLNADNVFGVQEGEKEAIKAQVSGRSYMRHSGAQ